MRRRILATVVLVLNFLHNGIAIEPEPNWSTRFAELKQAELSVFKPPKIGDRVTLEPRVGASITGKITAIAADTVTLDGKQFTASQLSSETCDLIFGGIYATKIATERLRSERTAYNARRQEELRKQREDANRYEAKKNASEAAATLKEEERLLAKTESIRIEALNEQHKQVCKTAIGVSVIVIVLCIIGFFVYILPSIIAFKRGHPNAGAICALNILLGWSFLGWVVSLVWALTQHAPANITVTVNRPATSPKLVSTQGKKIILKKK